MEFSEGRAKCVSSMTPISARYPYMFLSPSLEWANLWPLKAIFAFTTPNEVIFITISSDSVNSLPGSLNFTRSYHNQLNW